MDLGYVAAMRLSMPLSALIIYSACVAPHPSHKAHAISPAAGHTLWVLMRGPEPDFQILGCGLHGS